MTKCINYRENIKEPIKLLLAYKSGGRCAICNDLLYKDNLTLTLGNFADRAHIIPVKHKWARGSTQKKSKALETDYKNIILLCKVHHKIIDDNPQDWSTERLLAIKEQHEERIERLTFIKNEAKTNVLVIQSNIGGNPVEVNHSEIHIAVTENKMYPVEEKPFIIDLTGDAGDGDTSFYTVKAKEITIGVNAFIDKFNASTKRQHISIFPLALMPLLVHLGKELGDKHSIKLFQHRRTAHSWIWEDNISYPEYIIKTPKVIANDKNVYLKIALSDHINDDKLGSLKQVNSNIYEITVPKPHTHFLVHPDQLSKFDLTYRQVLNEIQHVHGKDAIIHLLLAAPCPLAVQCGMSLLIRKDPKIVVYDYNSRTNGFIEALTI